MTSEDIKHKILSLSLCEVIVQELCGRRGGRPELSESSGFRGRKELLNHASALVTTCP